MDYKDTPNNVEQDSWFVCYKPNPMARLRLFCFPYAGGGASSFYIWAKELPSDVETIGIQMPGMEARLMDPPITDIPLTVQMLTTAISPKLDKPFAFYGHSLGAFISFELARTLGKHSDRKPIHLFVSGIRAPQVQNPNPPIHDLSDREFLEQMRHRYNGIQKETLQDPDILQEVLPGLRASFEMYECYEYKSGEPLDCPITAFGGIQDSGTSREVLEAWCHQTRRGFTLHMIPGAHFFIHFEREHFLRVLSAEIVRTLAGLR